MDKDGSERLAIVTVHGTGDTAAEPEGEADGAKWFQTKSRFANQLKHRLGEHGLEADIVAHLWSGANSASERDKGARTLAKTVRRLAKSHKAGVHVIGHSHGGNVANDAAAMLNWSRTQRRPKIASITTVGTPFFRSHVTTSDRLGAWVFVIVALLSLFVIPAVTLYAGDSVTSALSDAINMPRKDVAFDDTWPHAPTNPERHVARPVITWIAANGFPLASGLTLLFMLPLALRGVRRIARAGRRIRDNPTIYSIWHPNDEAIAFLSRLEGVAIEPFPRWSLWRGSRTSGLIWGVRAIVLINLIGAALLALDVARGVDLLADPFQAYGAYVLLIGVAGAPLVFAAAYFLYRVFAAIVLELSLRGMLNNTIGAALIAIAFGRDGDHRIGAVSTCSHYYGAQREIIDGAVAQRMRDNAAEASKRLFDKYRAALFSVGTDEGNVVNELTQDAMTWDSLIHTTYFDQSEVAVLIGDYIAGAAQREAGNV